MIGKCKVISCDTQEEDYAISIERPDGTVVKVLIPREDIKTVPSRMFDGGSDWYHGLNMVCDGHYY